jgi:proteic killer suppression protein
MEIIFKTKQLEKCANDSKTAIKKWGAKRAELFAKRVTQLKALPDMTTVKNLPGQHHSLKGDRDGQWACKLDGGWRLVYRPIEEEGTTVYQIIKIEEVIDYH